MKPENDCLVTVLHAISKGFDDSNRSLTTARTRRFTNHLNDHTTSQVYQSAVEYELDKGNKERAAMIALEGKQYSMAIEIYCSLKRWEDAAFVAKSAGKCEAARDFYRKAGNEYYAQRMQDNLDAAKKSA